jgi:type IV secretory pathway VirB2 component (pilin)
MAGRRTGQRHAGAARIGQWGARGPREPRLLTMIGLVAAVVAVVIVVFFGLGYLFGRVFV